MSSTKGGTMMKSLHLYLYLFLGLALLASGCSKKEPAAQGDEQTTQEDTFMKHIYDVPSAKFYEPGEPNIWYRFTKDANTTMVDGFINIHGADDAVSDEKNDITFKRIDEKSTNGIAKFKNDRYDVEWNSKGAQIGLIYSDVGFIESQIISTKKENAFVYAGGRPEDIVSGDFVYDARFVGTAYGYVDLRQNQKVIEQLFVTTDPATATIDIDPVTQTETIVMPFKNWYRVTVVKTKDNKVTTKLDNDANKQIDQKWMPVHHDWVENKQLGTTEQANGLTVVRANRKDSDVGSVVATVYFGPGVRTEGVVIGFRSDVDNANAVRLNYVMGAVKADQ